jgi:hypothetical protein
VKAIQVIGSLALAGASLFATSDANAVELYFDAYGRPIPQPTRVVVVPPPPRVVLTVPQPRVHVQVVRQSPTIVVDPGPQPVDDRDDPYDTSGLVVAGAGVGGVLFLGDGITGAAVGYKLHLGLAVGAAEFALRFDLVPDAFEVGTDEGGTSPAAFYTMGASFNYRFLDSVVHPVAGVGVEGMVLDPHLGETGTAFAVTARAGLELAFPLEDGALALGIDVTGHLALVATDTYAADPVDVLSFGAYCDYRF